MDIKSYKDALAGEQSQLADYITRNVTAMAVPASKEDLDIGKSNFLTKSGWVFNVIGILAFIIGLLVGISGIWITGCASLVAGCYCIFKGKQQLEKEAYDNVGSSLLANIDKVIAYVSKTWTAFILSQNSSLRRDIVTSAMDTDAKVSSLSSVADNSFFHVDAEDIKKGISGVDATESLGAYKAYLPEAEKILSDSLAIAAKAQGDIYDAVGRQTAAGGSSTAASR